MEVGAGTPCQAVLDAIQLVVIDQRIPMTQTNLVGIACCFELLVLLEEFHCCLRYVTRFIHWATDLNPAMR